jgi:hypothetical protein
MIYNKKIPKNLIITLDDPVVGQSINHFLVGASQISPLYKTVNKCIVNVYSLPEF